MKTYNHTDVASRPIVLFHHYSKGKVPWLTVIRMWDKVSDYLLSSKHDPLDIGSGEVGFEDTTCINARNRHGSSSDLSTCTSSRKQKVKKKKLGPNGNDGFDDLSTMMSSVVSTCKELTRPSLTTSSSTINNIYVLSIEDLPLGELYKFLNQHRKHLDF